jgi:hypothetical protein
VTAASLVYWTTEVAADERSANAMFFLASPPVVETGPWSSA